MGLLIIAGGSLLLSQEYIKEKRKQRKWTRLRIRKRESKGAHYSIIHDLSLTDKEDFRKYLRINKLAAISILLFYLNKNWNYVFPLACSILCKWTLLMKKLCTTHACFCFYVIEFRKQKNMFCTSEVLLCFAQKNNFCIITKIKLVWFYSLYRNYFFE